MRAHGVRQWRPQTMTTKDITWSNFVYLRRYDGMAISWKYTPLIFLVFHARFHSCCRHGIGPHTVDVQVSYWADPLDDAVNWLQTAAVGSHWTSTLQDRVHVRFFVPCRPRPLSMLAYRAPSSTIVHLIYAAYTASRPIVASGDLVTYLLASWINSVTLREWIATSDYGLCLYCVNAARGDIRVPFDNESCVHQSYQQPLLLTDWKDSTLKWPELTCRVMRKSFCVLFKDLWHFAYIFAF